MGIIRFMLAISVVAFHVGNFYNITLPDGVVAVQSFYAISGFYMALILDERYDGKLRQFYINRFMRLYPLYLFVLFTYLLLLNAKILTIASAFTNFAIFGQAWSLFLNNNLGSATILKQSWTLDLELTFYCIIPFLVRLKTFYLVSIVAITFIIRHLFYSNGYNSDPWNYRFFPFELGIFLMGVLAFRFYNNFFRSPNKSLLNICGIFFLCADFIIIFYFSYFMGITTVSELYGNYFRWIFILLILVSLPFVFFISKNSKIDSFIGEFSYPVYILHLMVMELVGNAPLNVLAVTVILSFIYVIAVFIKRKIIFIYKS